jgi:hypothetical protein
MNCDHHLPFVMIMNSGVILCQQNATLWLFIIFHRDKAQLYEVFYSFQQIQMQNLDVDSINVLKNDGIIYIMIS